MVSVLPCTVAATSAGKLSTPWVCMVSINKARAALPTLFDYLPADALLVIDESHVSVPQVGAMYKGDRSRKETLYVNRGRLHPVLNATRQWLRNRPPRKNHGLRPLNPRHEKDVLK